jgi:3-oxoacyl-[acyl-carrier protein] reductase
MRAASHWVRVPGRQVEQRSDKVSEFSGETVLITGAGRGIGRDTALGFAAASANLCINYAHSADAATQTAQKIAAAGGKAITCKADISDSAQVNAMVTAAIDAFGAIDVLGIRSIKAIFPDNQVQ